MKEEEKKNFLEKQRVKEAINSKRLATMNQSNVYIVQAVNERLDLLLKELGLE